MSDSPIDQLAKLQSACPSQLSCVASETNEQGETEWVHIVQADGVYLNCPTGVRPPLAQFAVWAANNTEAIVAERDSWKSIVTQHCEDVRECREEAAKVIGDAAHGDSYCVPAIGDLVDMLIAQLAERDDEIERLRKCLTKANDQTEEYERKYYLEVNAKEDRDDEIERLRTALNNISAGVSYERSREIAYAALKGGE